MRFETGISAGNLKNWDVTSAVKEFVQNNVYANSILGDEVSITYDENTQTAYLTNKPSGFDRAKLLIGESTQAGVIGAPGEFGEGMKVAFAVLLRNDKKVTVETNGFTVVPKLLPSKLDKTVNSLWYDIEDNDNSSGTTVTIKGITKDELDSAMSGFAILRGVKQEDTKRNCILGKSTNGEGRIEVNGVWIQSIPALFDYNFVDTSLINRDRTSIDTNKLKEAIGTLIGGISDSDTIAYILDKVSTQEGSPIEFSVYANYNVCFPDMWKAVSQKVLGKKVALRSNQHADREMSYRGYSLIQVPWNWKAFFVDILGILQTSDLMEESKKDVYKATKNNLLDPVESRNLAWAKRTISLYIANTETVKVTDSLIDAYGNKCNGMYDPKTDWVWLNRDILQNRQQTFETLFHEMTHKTSGASDETAQFERALARNAYYMSAKITVAMREKAAANDF